MSDATDNDEPTSPSNRLEIWFSRPAEPAPVGRLAELADRLRSAADLLHGIEPEEGELAVAVDHAERLLAELRALPQVQRVISPADDPSPDEVGFLDRSPLSGRANPVAPPMVMSYEGARVVGTVTFGPAYEGPPGHAHGGWVASAFDEVMGMAQGLSASPGMTGGLEVTYRRPTPLGDTLRFEGWVDEIDGRKIRTRAEARSTNGELLAEATGLFISVDFERFRAMAAEAAGHGNGDHSPAS